MESASAQDMMSTEAFTTSSNWIKNLQPATLHRTLASLFKERHALLAGGGFWWNEATVPTKTTEGNGSALEKSAALPKAGTRLARLTSGCAESASVRVPSRREHTRLGHVGRGGETSEAKVSLQDAGQAATKVHCK